MKAAITFIGYTQLFIEEKKSQITALHYIFAQVL